MVKVGRLSPLQGLPLSSITNSEINKCDCAHFRNS
jgi:hypothetical protein